MQSKLTIFDLDDTLVTPNPEIDEQNAFMTIDHQIPIPLMMEQFHNTKHPKVILTNRHPILKDKIESIYGCPVICRDYCISKEDIARVMSSTTAKNQFLDDMVTSKLGVLKEFSAKYSQIIFYDDYAASYYKRKSEIPNNVQILLPLHMM